MTYGLTANRHGGSSKHLGGPVHGMFMERGNAIKIFLIYVVDEGTANICKNSKFHNGFLSYIPAR